LERIDNLLVKLGFADSIKMAQALVIAGDVLVNEQKVANSSVKFKETDKIRVKTNNNGDKIIVDTGDKKKIFYHPSIRRKNKKKAIEDFLKELKKK